MIILLQTGFLSAAFDQTDFSARSASLGDAYTAIADDGAGPFYNPAGILQMEKMEVMSTYAFIYPGLDINNINQMQLSFVLPIKKTAAVGLSYNNLGVNDLYSEQIIQLTFSKKLNSFWYLFGDKLRKNEFLVGGNVKLLKQGYTVDDAMRLDPVFQGEKTSTTGFTFDLGFMMRIFERSSRKFYNIGISAFNLTQPDIGLRDEDRVPMIIRAGFATPLKQFAFMKKISMDNPMFIIGADYRNKVLGFHFGWENSFLNELIYLRLGSTLLDFSTGLGFKYSMSWKYDVILDYAFILPYKIESTSGRHLVSLKFRF